jgi:NAD(P)-dependent dehydrogenase (short-subunit alcohol dehydrogenase family)
MGKLEGKIALITGGNSGIGLATAKAFVNEGAYVFITSRNSLLLQRIDETERRHGFSPEMSDL